MTSGTSGPSPATHHQTRLNHLAPPLCHWLRVLWTQIAQVSRQGASKMLIVSIAFASLSTFHGVWAVLTDGFPEYGSSFLPSAGSAPVQMHFDYSSNFHDQTSVSVSYSRLYESCVVDGYISTSSTSASSSPSSSSPLLMPYVLDHYPGMSSGVSESCGTHGTYDYQLASSAADWSQPHSSGLTYDSDERQPALGLRY